MNKSIMVTIFVAISMALVIPFSVQADVSASASDGFQIKIVKSIQTDATKVFDSLVNDVSKWWNADHTYSGKSENLSMDLGKGCMYEQLPSGGFVRHMEIVFFQPGKTLRLTGGLGPLQEMGVAGAMTFSLTPNGKTTDLELTYNVSGSSTQQLDKIAPAVEKVLSEQLESLKRHCDRSQRIK